MCSTTVKPEYGQALNEAIAAEKPFTAFDVTRRVRQLTGDHDPHYGHDGVRNFVVSEVGQTIPPSWMATLCTMKNGRDAIVYHPASVDPYDHPAADRGQAAPQTPAPASTPATDDDDDSQDPDPDSVVVKVTTARRVQIPKDFLNKVTPTGGTYDIFVNGDLVCRKPNKDGRIRIGKKALDRAGITSNAKISFDTKTNSILVHPSI